MLKNLSTAVKATIAATLLAISGYFGYSYFQANYVLLNQDQVMELQMQVEVMQQQALQYGYAVGQESCKKSL